MTENIQAVKYRLRLALALATSQHTAVNDDAGQLGFDARAYRRRWEMPTAAELTITNRKALKKLIPGREHIFIGAMNIAISTVASTLRSGSKNAEEAASELQRAIPECVELANLGD